MGRKAWLVLGFSLLACQSPSKDPARPIEVLVPTEAATLDPRYCTRSLDIKVTRLVHAGLVGLHPATLAPVPLVARSWKWMGPRSLEVTLRPGVRFHSGAELSARDVCATLEALADPKLASPHRTIVRAIGKCDVSRPDRVVLGLKKPRATLLTDLEVPILRHDQAQSAPRPDGNLDGLGPYSIREVGPGHIELAPADTGIGAPPVHALSIRTVRDENARALRLLAGRADVAPNAISPVLLPSLATREGLEVATRAGANVTYLLIQNDRPPLSQSEVRHALAWAIDREEIVRTLLGGHAQVASFLLPQGHWATPDGQPPEPYAPERARPILGGKRPLTLLTSTERARVTIARAIAQMLSDAGASVRVVSLDLGVLLERLNAGDFDLATLQMPELTEPHILSWFFHPRGVPGEGGEGRNRARYRSAQAGRLMDEAGATRDRRKRRALYAELAKVMRKDLPVVPLWHEDQLAVVSDRARGFVPSAEGRWGALARLK